MLSIRKYDWKLSLPETIIKSPTPAAAGSGFAKRLAVRGPSLALTRGRRASMREWHKPTIDETESGMEVTSYLPAELDRA
jgi:coenzyme PQQ precursor peptide PqqA